jgi:hypothetical protein
MLVGHADELGASQQRLHHQGKRALACDWCCVTNCAYRCMRNTKSIRCVVQVRLRWSVPTDLLALGLGDADVEAHARLARRWDELVLYLEHEFDNRDWASTELARLLPAPISSRAASPVAASPVIAEPGLTKRTRSYFDDSDDDNTEDDGECGARVVCGITGVLTSCGDSFLEVL